MRLFKLLPFLCFAPLFLIAQTSREAHQAAFQIKTHRTTESIRVDGNLNEDIWSQYAAVSNFSMKWPRDGGPAPEQTEVRCLYDDKYLYVGITAHDTTPQYIVQGLKRDASYWDSDGVAVILDPSNVTSNGYFFGTSAYGVQVDALIAPGGDDMDTNWDNTWRVETKRFPDRWTAEYAIPLRILRFKEGQNTWGINIIRNDLTNGMYSTWATVPFQFDGTDLGWTGALVWDEAPRKTKGNYNLIPYVSGGIAKDYEANEPRKNNQAIGMDAKVGIGSGLNLDVTINPDFSQIEIDEQVVNLTRFNVQLPEKRTFFLENADIFSNYGIPPIRPLFSRRIGLNPDGTPATILGGLRLTGNLGSDTRIGALSMQTQPSKGATQNFSALSLKRQIWGRSSVAGYFVGRESFSGSERLKNQYTRNAGVELNFITSDGKWEHWVTHHRSYNAGVDNKNWWGNTGINYATRKFNILVDLLHMGENYTAELGFEQRIENYDALRDTVLRIGYNFIFSQANYRIFPKKEDSKLNFTEFFSELFQVINPDGTLNESSNKVGIEFNLKNTSTYKFSLSPNLANVPVSFKFDDEDSLALCPPLPLGRYQFLNGALAWSSDYRKNFYFGVNAAAGQFYNGKIYTAGFEINLRVKTLANFKMTAAYNQLDFPAPYCDVSFFNITPRIEVFFSKSIWWTTFIQYNTQSDNFNINSRFQWRFRPMSDLFLVYTDNYGISLPGVKNRALVAKANYWF